MKIDPPLTHAGAFPLTALMCVSAIVASVTWWAGQPLDALLPTQGNIAREPWTLLSSTLLHVSPIHLLFNLLWMWQLGSRLERACGGLRYAAILLLLALISSAAEYAVGPAGVGLSGVVYGLCAFIWVVQRRVPALQNVVGEKTVQLFVVWFFVCIILTFTNILSVGNMAHGVGALTGWLLGLSGWPAHWRQAPTPARDLESTPSVDTEPTSMPATLVHPAPTQPRIAAVAGLIGLTVLAGLGATIGRPWTNYSSTSTQGAALGAQALQQGRIDDALRLLEAAHRDSPRNAPTIVTLGVAYQKKGRSHEALDLYRDALRIDPKTKQNLAPAAASILGRESYDAANRGDLPRALALAQEALMWDPGNVYAEQMRVAVIERQKVAKPNP